jgi:hypothetical protein
MSNESAIVPRIAQTESLLRTISQKTAPRKINHACQLTSDLVAN